MTQTREYVPQGLTGYKLVDDAAHIYEKELIYADNFLMRNKDFSFQDFLNNKEGARYELEVKDDAIRGWASTGNMMLSRGFEITMPVGHNGKEPKAKIIRLFQGKNENGKASLRGFVQFPDKETAEQYKNTDISIFSEEEAEDPQGAKYAWPITHVCFTDYPSIPKLEPFRAIAASLLDTPEKEKEPVATKVTPTPNVVNVKDETLDTLIKRYGIVVSEKATDEEKKKAISDYLKSVNDQFALAVTAPTTEPNVPDVTKTNTPKTDEKPVAVAASLLNMVTNARVTELENLVRERKITPAQRDALKKKWCTKEKITIACSQEDDDGFQEELEILKMNTPQKDGSKTAHQHIELSQGNSSLVENAKKRAEKEEERRKKSR